MSAHETNRDPSTKEFFKYLACSILAAMIAVPSIALGFYLAYKFVILIGT